MSEYQPQMTAHSAVELVVSVVDVSKGERYCMCTGTVTL